MSDKIIPFKNKELVDFLEFLTEQARQGEVKAVSVALVFENGDVGDIWTGKVDECATLMYGAINILRDCYFHDMIEHHGTADLGAMQ